MDFYCQSLEVELLALLSWSQLLLLFANMRAKVLSVAASKILFLLLFYVLFHLLCMGDIVDVCTYNSLDMLIICYFSKGYY